MKGSEQATYIHSEVSQGFNSEWGLYHKTLKSGCKIEQRQLGNADRIEACLAIDMVVSRRIYHLTKLAREVSEVPCTVYFEEAAIESIRSVYLHKRRGTYSIRLRLVEKQLLEKLPVLQKVVTFIHNLQIATIYASSLMEPA